MIVYLVFFEDFSYSEENHVTDVLRVFRLESDADSFCTSLIDSNKNDFYCYYVLPFEVF